MQAGEVDAAIERLPELVNGNAPLVARGRYLSTVFLVEVGAAQFYVSVEQGRVARVERGPLLSRPVSFSVRAGEDAWRRFWQPVPEPGYHDLLAMFKLGEAKIEGDWHTVMAHLRYLKDVLAAPRARAKAGAHA
ncbi:MAG TPA: hypothetical protein VMK05_14185 [Burkholderiales bacterium]|nr:hypothetical protein [Burkholderiales bacterium]